MGRSDLQKLLDEKKSAKKHLYDEYWVDSNMKEPLVIIFTTKEKSNHELVYKLLEGLLILPMHVMVVSEEEPADHTKHPSGKIIWLNPESGKNAIKLESSLIAADMAIIFDEKQNTIHTLFEKGVVPIGHAKSPLLENYHPNAETGNSFTYSDKNPWGVFAALVRACETFHFPYDWQHIIRSLLKVR